MPETTKNRAQRVLVVDDDVSVLAMVMRWLSDAGLEAVTCQTVETARVCLDAWRPDVLVTDVRVDLTNGLHLVVLARQRVPPIKSIVMSGFDDPVLSNEARAEGASFLLKPLSREQLVGLIRTPADRP
jgi:DNA-binding NtrC family response regulator